MSTFVHRYTPIAPGTGTFYSPEFRPSLKSARLNIQLKHTQDLAAVGISDISNALPAVVTTSGDHGLSLGMSVHINCETMESIHDQTFTVTVLSANTFELDASNSSMDPPFDSGSYTIPVGDITTSVEGSVNGDVWVELVAGASNPAKIADVRQWPHWRLKHVVTNFGNNTTFQFFVAEKAGIGY